MYRKLLLWALLFILMPTLMFAQMGKLRGLITDTDTGEPLIGANVMIEGTTMGAASDMSGTYIVLAVPPGVYSVRVTYVGYQAEVTQNIRVSANQTTTHDFQLTTTAIRGEALVIVAERPLIQRNTTNTIRMTTEEDIQSLPIRGFQNIMALNAGTVLQDGNLHIRGGRRREVAYFIDGATTTNPMDQEGTLDVIQEAIEEIQMQAGGFTAEFGGANSAVVNTTMRTGGARMRGTLDYRTDDFVKGGNEFLGTTSRGYHNVVATVGGPIGGKLRYFVAGQYNHLRNRTGHFIEPFTFDPLDETLPEWSQDLWDQGQREFYAPWFVEDGASGRSDQVGNILTNAAGDSIPLTFEKNYLPNNWRKDMNIQGTLVYDLATNLKLRLTGLYARRQYPANYTRFETALNNYFSNIQDERTRQNYLFNLRATHVINPTTFYDVAVSWSTEKYKEYDPRFGDDWMAYCDSLKWANRGYDSSDWDKYFADPIEYSIIYDFTLQPPNSYVDDYYHTSATNLGASLDFTTQLTKNFELKFGGRFDRWSMRKIHIDDIPEYLEALYGSDGSYYTPDDPGRDGDHSSRDFAVRDVQGNELFSHEYMKRLELIKMGNVYSYGWDYTGTEKINEGAYGPRKPFYGSAYIQTKFEYRDLILNLGLRFERYDFNAYRPVDFEWYTPEGEEPDYDKANEWVIPEKLIQTDPYDYFLPRLNFAFPVTDNTVFYAQYGKYAQNIAFEGVYRSVNQLRYFIPEQRSPLGSDIRSLVKPERTNQYEVGIRQTITPEFAFTVTAFYKDLLDQVRYDRVYSEGKYEEEGGLPYGTRFSGAWLNNDIGTSKGVELTLELRRTKRLAAKVNYTLSDTRGTGSSLSSNSVMQSDETTARFPMLIYPLDHNQPHRGTVMLDYRFAKGDGGKILEGIGLNTLITFNSGHAYTAIEEPLNLGQASAWTIGTRAMRDHRGRHPVEPINNSATPWNFNIDITLEKMFYFDRINLRLYTTVLNLLNTRNVINVYDQTGVPTDDGWLKSPMAVSYLAIPGYHPFYSTVNLTNEWGYQYAEGQESLWGVPRQIRFGLMVEFQ